MSQPNDEAPTPKAKAEARMKEMRRRRADLPHCGSCRHFHPMQTQEFSRGAYVAGLCRQAAPRTLPGHEGTLKHNSHAMVGEFYGCGSHEHIVTVGLLPAESPIE